MTELHDLATLIDRSDVPKILYFLLAHLIHVLLLCKVKDIVEDIPVLPNRTI